MSNEIVSLSATDDSNVARMPELQAPSTVNNGVRALEGMLARWARDLMGQGVNVGGTGNAITLAINSTTAAAARPEIIGFYATATNSGAVTVTITPSGGAARAALAIQKNAAALTGGEIILGRFHLIWFDGAAYQLVAAGNGFGTVALPGIAFDGDPDTGFYRTGANALAAAVGGAQALAISAAGEITYPLQPCVLAYNSSQDANATGDGTEATVDFDTEIFDQNGDFSGDTFTAPVTGKFLICAGVKSSGYDGTQAIAFVKLLTSNRTILLARHRDLPNGFDMAIGGAVIADMDAADTATVSFGATAGNKVVDIDGSASDLETYISVYLVA